MLADSNDDTNFPHKLLSTNTQVSKLRKVFVSNSSAKNYQIGQSGAFLGRLLGPLLKNGLSLMKNVLKPLAKSVFIPLGLTTSVTDAAIKNKTFGSGMTTLIISNEEMDDIMKILNSLEYVGLLIIGVSKTIENEAKEQKGGFLGMLLGTLGDSLLGNLLTRKGVMIAGEGTIRAGEGAIKAGQNF